MHALAAEATRSVFWIYVAHDSTSLLRRVTVNLLYALLHLLLNLLGLCLWLLAAALARLALIATIVVAVDRHLPSGLLWVERFHSKHGWSGQARLENHRAALAIQKRPQTSTESQKVDCQRGGMAVPVCGWSSHASKVS